MKTAIFKIEGMHCDGCAETIKALVEKQPGVQVADVSYSRGEVRVLFDPNLTARDQLITVIQKPGFRVVGHR